MSVIKKQADTVSNDCHTAAGVGFDPTIIITIITTLLQLFGGCKKTPTQALASAQNPNNLEKWVVRREIKKAYGRHSDDQTVVYAALLDHAAKMKLVDVKAMYAEVGL